MHDISPNVLVSGGFDAPDPEAVAELIERTHALLADMRFIAAVRHDAQDPDRGDEIEFTLVCDEQRRVLRVDEAGEVTPGDTVSETEAMLSRELCREVELWAHDDENLCPCCNGDEEEDHEEDSDADDTCEADDIVITLGKDKRVIFATGPFDSDDLDDDLDEDFDDDLDEDEDRVLSFSRRGPSHAGLISLLRRPPVEVGIEGDWSVFRYSDDDYDEVPAATRDELPAIEIRGPATRGAWVDVHTPATLDEDEHFFCPAAAEFKRPVLDDSVTLGADAARLLAVTVNEHLLHDSELSQLITDPTIEVNADALRVAFDSAFPGSPGERLVTVLTGLGVPAPLARAAVNDESLPAQRVYGETGALDTLLRIAEDGSAGMRPLGKKPTLLGRIDDAVRSNTALAYAFAAGEAALGVAAAVAGSRARGGRKVLGLVGGAILISDAVIDAILATRRARRAQR